MKIANLTWTFLLVLSIGFVSCSEDEASQPELFPASFEIDVEIPSLSTDAALLECFGPYDISLTAVLEGPGYSQTKSFTIVYNGSQQTYAASTIVRFENLSEPGTYSSKITHTLGWEKEGYSQEVSAYNLESSGHLEEVSIRISTSDVDCD
ncbi:MAG: hypothetical protein JXR07_08785 [Reichenbachiella sp.]